MKDFYKILGVKENASEEEIRARWVELTKHYHPDRGEDIASEEKIREINEAYQVLKHSSTRVEYDLKRTYNHGKREGKRVVNFKRWGVPVSILIILIIVGVIYFRNFETNQINQINLSREMRSLFHWDQTDQRNQTDQTEQKTLTNQKHQIDEQNQINQKDSSRLSRSESVRGEMPLGLLSHRDQTNQIDQMNHKDQINEKDHQQIFALTIQQVSASTQQTQRLDPPIDSQDPKLQLTQPTPPSPLVTEDEVKKFFNNYVEHYNRMDREVFLSLFSSKATQNQKEELEGIRKIYTDFFNQGQEVRLKTEEMKIEIYQNAVEVKARYEIEQIVKKSGERKIWRGPIRWVLIKEDGTLKILSVDYQHEKAP